MVVKCLKIRKISANSTFIFNECLLVARFFVSLSDSYVIYS